MALLIACPFPSASCNPGLELPKHVFPFVPPGSQGPVSRSHQQRALGSPELSAKTLREPQASPPITPNLSDAELFISTALPHSKHHHRLFPTYAKIWSRAQPLFETEASFVFVFLFLPKTSHPRTGRLPPASRCYFGSGLCRLAAASQGPLQAVGSPECCSHPAWKALH